MGRGVDVAVELPEGDQGEELPNLEEEEGRRALGQLATLLSHLLPQGLHSFPR